MSSDNTTNFAFSPTSSSLSCHPYYHYRHSSSHHRSHSTLRQSREGLLRFLRADKYDLQLCIDRIEKCLVWRRKEGMDDLEGLAKRVEGEVSTLPHNTSSIRLDRAKSKRRWHRCADHGYSHDRIQIMITATVLYSKGPKEANSYSGTTSPLDPSSSCTRVGGKNRLASWGWYIW